MTKSCVPNIVCWCSSLDGDSQFISSPFNVDDETSFYKIWHGIRLVIRLTKCTGRIVWEILTVKKMFPADRYFRYILLIVLNWGENKFSITFMKNLPAKKNDRFIFQILVSDMFNGVEITSGRHQIALSTGFLVGLKGRFIQVSLSIFD